ncbi:cysteine--1-D-myo-inosityl 2-amino-2-deoxy-alpha-D-glucopyranoside ligase [Micromonospora sp. Llam0]|uniref:cysteine--1-D-myo-inosityl 2-amino-2-deoxy-alpha-D-glucopyranoside ligase n=1 Tax=Micromonospora sp. Llam0 TaxID=2485143 RepID=UPI001F3BE96B|nr:cysteine--1-D-myo-inosityl 2-amino-2-deoxy-alpha-D-glucopyranoside ligase [Micromonospora sp. Llam0]
MSLYVCGVTPYDSAHTGHLAMAATYDVIARRLRSLGARVRVVRNITDVDDPLLPRAARLNIPYWDLVEQEVSQWNADIRRLNLTSDVEPRASQHIDHMVSAIEEMSAAGRTYEIEGTIYFRISPDSRFGEVSHFDRARMVETSRERGGDPDRAGKEDPLDFILWQPSRPGEPQYDAPFGRGRPGWHIGCSVMSREHCGMRVDIHGGGADLIFPHHECEAAQDRSMQHSTDVGIWFHSALLDYKGEKMSKSRGNIVLARDLLARYNSMTVRLATLSHYTPRGGGEWQDHYADEAAERLAKWTRAAESQYGPDPRRVEAEFYSRLDNNVELGEAVAVADELVDQTLTYGGSDSRTPRVIRDFMAVLGLERSR